MMRRKHWFLKILLMVLGGILGFAILSIGVLSLVSYIKHINYKKQENKYLVPPGDFVEVNGHDIHVLHEGDYDAETTLVFLHANNMIDDSIVLSPLFKNLEEFNLIYVDRNGYGFSDVYNSDKSVDAMLEETREAISKSCTNKKYILVATKSAGVQAIYWAHKYPEEVEAIIGLEMFFPDQYKELSDDQYCGFSNKLLLYFTKIGAHRYAKNIYPKNDQSIYSDKQMATRNVLISNKFYTRGRYNEDKMVVKNAKKVSELGMPNVPMYLIYANPYMDPYLHDDEATLKEYTQIRKQGEEQGKDFDCEKSYNEFYRDYASNYKNITMLEVSGPERLITYNPTEISELIKNYAKSLE